MRGRLAVSLAALVVVATLAVAGGSRGQGQRQVEPIEPGLALLAATMSYSDEPFAERLRVYVGSRPWEGRSDSVVVRCDPVRGRVRLELGLLEAYLADGQMVAVRRDNPRDALVRAYQPPLTMAKLADLLPPVPAPGLALALDENLNAVAPYLPVRAWRSADMDAATELTTLTGELVGGGVITAHLERSGRVGDVVAQVAEDRWVSIQVTAAQPGEPGQWAIDASGRRRVRSLADLAPARAARAGDSAPDLLFVDGEGRPWRLSEALEGGPVAIALVRAGRSGAMEGGRAALAALGQTDVAAVVAVVYTMEQWSLEGVRRDLGALAAAVAGEARGSDEGAEAGADGDGLVALWSVSPGQTRDIAPGEPAVIVVVGADGTVRGVIAVAGREVGEVAAEVAAAVGA